jgi:hypothetical protein
MMLWHRKRPLKQEQDAIVLLMSLDHLVDDVDVDWVVLPYFGISVIRMLYYLSISYSFCMYICLFVFIFEISDYEM